MAALKGTCSINLRKQIEARNPSGSLYAPRACFKETQRDQLRAEFCRHLERSLGCDELSLKNPKAPRAGFLLGRVCLTNGGNYAG